jgi:hypothetical protein
MMIGDSGSTPWLELRNVVNLAKHLRLFEVGKLDTFYVRGPSVGRIRAIRLLHDGFGPSPDWFCASVAVAELGPYEGISTNAQVDDGSHEFLYFPINTWIRSNQPIEALPATAKQPAESTSERPKPS